jgi:hypothetical protein
MARAYKKGGELEESEKTSSQNIGGIRREKVEIRNNNGYSTQVSASGKVVVEGERRGVRASHSAS